jgi:hypothetical protein
MTIRAYVQDDYRSFGLSVLFVLETEDHPREIARFTDGSFVRWEQVAPGDAIEPSLVLPDGDFARALLDTLTRHYHGAEDTRALRRDYESERSRVDQLIGTVSKIADQATTPLRPPVFSQERP